MLALVLAAAITRADLQQWIDDQPEVRAYEMQKTSLGLHAPPDEAFRVMPRLPQRAACEGRASAMTAAVKLFKTTDASKLTLTEPELQARNDGKAEVMLDDAGKKALTDRAQQYEQDAGRLEPACLG